MSAFEITRIDGRSNAQVIIDLTKDAEPGRIFTYPELASALESGADKKYSVSAIRGAVVGAMPRLLKESQRALYSVRRVGYRLAAANEHGPLAVIRKRKADTQLKWGLRILKHVRWDELDPNTRTAHQGQLMVLEGLYRQQHAFDNRLKDVEKAIASITNKT